MASGSETAAPNWSGEQIAVALDNLREKVDLIRTWNSATVYWRLKLAAKERANLEKAAKKLHAESLDKLNTLRIFVPTSFNYMAFLTQQHLLEFVRDSHFGSASLLSMLRIQEAGSALSALIERKYAYAFGFVSLYFALLAIAVGIYPILFSREDHHPRESSQVLFRVEKRIYFAPGKAAAHDGRSNIDLTADICDSKRELAAAGSTVAFVLGRHDHTPLTRTARLLFSTNAGLAQQRADTVAGILDNAGQCGPAIPTVITLVGAPHYVGEGKDSDQLRGDREVIIYGLKRVADFNPVTFPTAK